MGVRVCVSVVSQIWSDTPGLYRSEGVWGRRNNLGVRGVESRSTQEKGKEFERAEVRRNPGTVTVRDTDFSRRNKGD